jgi:thiosulfate dehydrogenase [quinone] large subunit
MPNTCAALGRAGAPAPVRARWIQGSVAAVDRAFARMAWVLVGLRVFMGVLWLANLSWKLPPDFGRDQPRGLLFSFRQAEQYAGVEPLRQFVRHVVIPHFTVFGWQVFLVEAAAGVLLLLGWHTRLGAAIGAIQSSAIMALTVRAPHEWFWGYAMFVLLNLSLLVAPANLHLSLDRRQGRA